MRRLVQWAVLEILNDGGHAVGVWRDKVDAIQAGQGLPPLGHHVHHCNKEVSAGNAKVLAACA